MYYRAKLVDTRNGAKLAGKYLLCYPSFAGSWVGQVRGPSFASVCFMYPPKVGATAGSTRPLQIASLHPLVPTQLCSCFARYTIRIASFARQLPAYASEARRMYSCVASFASKCLPSPL